MSSSQTFDLAGIVKAMVAATEFVGGDLESWQPALEPDTMIRQERLLGRLRAINFDLTRIPELRAWASMTPSEINEVLRREGFEIQVDWQPDGRTFGVVSILDVAVQWLEEGDGDSEIRVYPRRPDGSRDYRAPEIYPAFELAARANRIEFLEVPGSDQPLVRIPTRSGDVVCIHVMPQPDLGLAGFRLYGTAARLSGQATPEPDKYGKVKDVTIPKVKLRQEVDISWMQGLTFSGRDSEGNPDLFGVEAAKQEVRFVMNEEGARAKTATALVARSLSVTVGGQIEHIRVDNDFLFWIERPGVAVPVFVAYLAKEDAWKDPGSLDNV